MSGLSDLESNSSASGGEEDTTSRPQLTFREEKRPMAVSKLGGPRFEVEKFDGRNDYVLWERQVTSVLRAMGLGKVLRPRPDDVDDDDWSDIQDQAVSIVVLYLKPNVFKQMEEAATVAALFAALREKYHKKELSNRLYTALKLSSFRMAEGTKIQDHVDAFNDLAVDLENLGEDLSDERKAIQLLSSLPASYQSLSRVLLHRDQTTITYNEVVTALLTDDMQQKLLVSVHPSSGQSTSSSTALTVSRGRTATREEGKGKTKTKPRSRSKSRDGKSVKCWKCGKSGHIRKDCRSKATGESSANVAITEDSGYALCTSSHVGNDEWILDSACSYHICHVKEFFSSYTPSSGTVFMGNDQPCKIVGTGSVKIQMFDGVVRTLTNVRHIPSMCKNLISLGELDLKGFKWSTDGGVLSVVDGSHILMRSSRLKNLYILEGTTIFGEAHVITSPDLISHLWHNRLGHMSEKGLAILHKQSLLPGMRQCKLEFCEHCVFGKQTRAAFGVGVHSSKDTLDYIHSDVWGPSPSPSHSGKVYYVTFVDDYSRFVWIYFMQQKSEVFEIFKNWKALVETQTGRKVRYLRTDNGGEYNSTEFQLYCEKEGVTRHLTTPYTPEQNGVSERLNRTLLERSRSMLSLAGLPHTFWAEAVNTAAYLVNLSPNSSIKFKTPFELWYKRLADYSMLKVFGCDAYALTPKDNRTKLDPKAKKCVFLGYQRGVKGYRLWDVNACKLVVSRDVSFNESRSLNEGEKVQTPVTDKGKALAPDTVEGEIDIDTTDDGPQGEVPPVVEQEELIAGEPHTEPAHVDQAESSSRRQLRSAAERQAPARYGTWFDSSQAIDDIEADVEDSGDALITEDGEPSSFSEAQASSEKQEWHAAMQKEMKSLHANNTWELVELPQGKRVVDCKWVYKKKDGPTDADEKIFKARLVAKGFTQRKGVDYNEVFAPVAKYSTIRLLCALVILYDLVFDQMDVVTAFLYGLLDEVIFMRQPQGFLMKGKEGMVCRLLKSLYGLKQSPRQWNKRFNDFMHSQGFLRSVYDPCVYLKKVPDAAFGLIILVLYVDDMLIAAPRRSDVDKLKAQLSSTFSMKDLGPVKKILGMEVFRDQKEGKLWLSQQKYAEKVLAKFNMADAKPVNTPLAAHFLLSAAQCPTDAVEKGLMSSVPYESAVGSLMYLMVCTRPDIAFAVGKVSRYMSNPGKVHWEAVKWILRYLKGSTRHGLLFDAKTMKAKSLLGYVDADHGGDLDKRKSTTGYAFTLTGGCISWRSTLQKCISLSSTEAEYVAAAEATKEAIWLNKLITEMGLPQQDVNLHCDSQSALHLAENQVMDSRVKHIDIRYHFIRQAVSENALKLIKIDGELNPADGFTKVIPSDKFSRHRATLQILHR